MTEYVADIRERGEITIPKQLRERYHLTKRTEVKLIPKVDGILIKPRVKDPISHLRGLAKNVWPEGIASVDIIREIRKRAVFEAKEHL